MQIDSKVISKLYLRMVSYDQVFYDQEMDPLKKDNMLVENSHKEMGALLLIKGLEAFYGEKIINLEDVHEAGV